jgi:serine/threonine-protein kinase
MVLEVIEGPRKGATLLLEDDCVFLVGRSRRCHYQLGNDPQSSRVHFVIESNPPICRLRDLGSLNGTWVNGQRVQEAEVKEGDTIGAGRSLLRLRGAEPARPAPAVAAKPGPAPKENEPVRPAAAAARPPAVDDEATAPMRCLRCGKASAAVALPDQPAALTSGFVCTACQEAMHREGETLPGYRLIRRLDEGGMALLWLAQDTRDGRQVVIKTMTPDLAASQRAVRMFHRECKISLQLHHPHIVAFLNAGQYDGKLYMVMEHVDGPNAERLRREKGGRLPPEEVVLIGTQVLEALACAHGQGIVHRDVKPSNILVPGQFPAYDVKVTDFGLARVYHAAGWSNITRQGDVRGSLPYMPPEQVLNCRGVDHRADIFALGATLYHLLTGCFCYEFNPKQKDPMLTLIEDEIIPIEQRGASLPAGLAEVVHRSLRREPDQRYQSAQEMEQALAHAL